MVTSQRMALVLFLLFPVCMVGMMREADDCATHPGEAAPGSPMNLGPFNRDPDALVPPQRDGGARQQKVGSERERMSAGDWICAMLNCWWLMYPSVCCCKEPPQGAR